MFTNLATKFLPLGNIQECWKRLWESEQILPVIAKEARCTSRSWRVFSETWGADSSPPRAPENGGCTAAVCADTLRAHPHCVWSHLWHRYNMMQTRRREIQVRLPPQPFRDFSLCENFSPSTTSRLSLAPFLSLLLSLLHYCWALSPARCPESAPVRRSPVVTLTLTFCFPPPLLS